MPGSVASGTLCINEFNRSSRSCGSKNYSMLWDYTYYAVTEHLHMFSNINTITTTSLCYCAL